MDTVLFSPHFIQDLMNTNLYGRDHFTEYKNRFRGFSLFSVGPIDFNHNAGETQPVAFLRQEGSKLKLDETIALEKSLTS